jgi:hypothetical protein
MMMKGGKSMVMEKETTFANGTKVMPDGKVVAKDGKRTMLKEGMTMGTEGMIKGGRKSMKREMMNKKDGMKSAPLP